jgi:membrane fusion protein (multidrug efflux system)
MTIIYWSTIIVFALACCLYWFIFWRNRAWTNDAYVNGNQVYITPLHEGFVTSIHTDDTYLVKRNELLVELDKTDALIRFDRTKSELAETVRDVCQLFHQVFVYKSEIETKKAEFIKAAQDFQHRWGVLPASGVSLEDYEHAVAALRATYFTLQTTETLYYKSLSLVQSTTIQDHPLVKTVSDRMRDAWVYLYRCNIYSPVEGLAAQRTIQVGMWIPSGTFLMSVIPLDQIWVNANFKETQLRHMKIGQRVKITSDLYGHDVVFHGKIAGLPGVAGNAVSLLPPQNLSGNWIKIVQRLPVRVELDPEELKIHPLRIGLSMEVTVDLDDAGPLVPTSTAGSPLYHTPIFKEEELGDLAFIDTVIDDNLDPTLTTYLEQPINLTLTPLRISSRILAALSTNPLLPFAPPLPPQMNQADPTPEIQETVYQPPIQAVPTEPECVLPPEPILPEMPRIVLTDQAIMPSNEELNAALKGFSLDALLDEAMNFDLDQ